MLIKCWRQPKSFWAGLRLLCHISLLHKPTEWVNEKTEGKTMSRATIRKSDRIGRSFTVGHQHGHGLKNNLYQRCKILSTAKAAHKTFVVGWVRVSWVFKIKELCLMNNIKNHEPLSFCDNHEIRNPWLYASTCLFDGGPLHFSFLQMKEQTKEQV